jgi:NDP-sugar pyrophosphorylase family protein
MQKEISLIYMVAGMSSRFWWKIKQFAKVWPNDSSLIEYSLQQALPAGFKKIIFIVGNMTEWPFKEIFWNTYKWIPIEYAKQTFDETTRDKPRWTVDALCSAIEYINGPCVVCNGDDIYWSDSFKKIYDHLQDSDECACIWYILEKVIPEEWSTNRGIFKVDSENYVQDIKEIIGIEKQKLSEIGLNKDDLCSMNIFWLNTNAIKNLQENLIKFKETHHGDRKVECYLPIEISNLIKEKWLKMKLYSTSDPRFGVTNPQDEEIVKQQIEEYEQKKQN